MYSRITERMAGSTLKVAYSHAGCALDFSSRHLAQVARSSEYKNYLNVKKQQATFDAERWASQHGEHI